MNLVFILRSEVVCVAILFCYEFFCYVLNNSLPYMTAKKIARWVLTVPVLYPLTILFLRIDYLTGRGTNYSYGPAAFLGYGLAMLLFFVSFLLVLFGKNLDISFKDVILPMLTLMLAGVRNRNKICCIWKENAGRKTQSRRWHM